MLKVLLLLFGAVFVIVGATVMSRAAGLLAAGVLFLLAAVDLARADN